MRICLPTVAILGPRVIIAGLDHCNYLPKGGVKLAAVNIGKMLIIYKYFENNA